MQQIIADILVAGAVLFLARWLFRSFVAKRNNQPACGNCPQCAGDATPAVSTRGHGVATHESR